MGMISLKMFFLTFLGVVVLLGLLGISKGLLRFGADKYECYPRPGAPDRYYYDTGDPERWLTVFGRIHLYYQPKAYGCPVERRFDPNKYRVENGLLVPILK